MSTDSGGPPASGEQLVVTEESIPPSPPATITVVRIGSMARTAVATPASNRFGHHHPGFTVGDQECRISGGVMREVHRHRRSRRAGWWQKRLDELRPVQHQTNTRSAHRHTAPTQRTGQGGEPGGSAHPTWWCGRGTAVPWHRAASTRWRASWLVPVLSAGQKGLPTGDGKRSTADAPLGHGRRLRGLIFDQTWLLPRSQYGSAARGQPTPDIGNKPGQ